MLLCLGSRIFGEGFAVVGRSSGVGAGVGAGVVEVGAVEWARTSLVEVVAIEWA